MAAIFAGMTPEQILDLQPSAFQTKLPSSISRPNLSQRHINSRLIFLFSSAFLYGTLSASEARNLRYEFSLGVCCGRELLEICDEKSMEEKIIRGEERRGWVPSVEVIREISTLSWVDLNVLALLTESTYQCVKFSDSNGDIYKAYSVAGDSPVSQKRARWFRTLWNMPTERIEALYALKTRIDAFVRNAIRLNQLQTSIPLAQSINEVTGVDFYQIGCLTGAYTADTLVNVLRVIDFKDQEILIGIKLHMVRLRVLPEGIRLSDVNFSDQYVLFPTWDTLKEKIRSTTLFGEVLDVYQIGILSKTPSEFEPPPQYYSELHSVLQQRSDQATNVIFSAIRLGDVKLFKQMLAAHRGQSLKDFIEGICPEGSERLVNFSFSEEGKFTLLVRAAERRDPIFVKTILEQGLVDVNQVSGNGLTALFYALFKGNSAVALFLLDVPNIDINFEFTRSEPAVASLTGKRPIDLAIKGKDLSVLNALLLRAELIVNRHQLQAILALAETEKKPELAHMVRERLKFATAEEPEEKAMVPESDMRLTKAASRTFADLHPDLAFNVYARAMGDVLEKADIEAFRALVSDPVNGPFIHKIFSRPEEPSDSPFGGLAFIDFPGNILMRLFEMESMNSEFARNAFRILKEIPHFADSINQYWSQYPEGGTILQLALQRRSQFLPEILRVPGIDFNLQRISDGKTIIHDLDYPQHREILAQVTQLVQSRQIVLDFDLVNAEGKPISAIVPKLPSPALDGEPSPPEPRADAALDASKF